MPDHSLKDRTDQTDRDINNHHEPDTDFSEKDKEKAFAGFKEKLESINRNLSNDFSTAMDPNGDHSQLSWVKRAGSFNADDIYNAVTRAIQDNSADERKYLVESTVEALVTHARDNIKPEHPTQHKYAQLASQDMTDSLLSHDSSEFSAGYRKLIILQSLQRDPESHLETARVREARTEDPVFTYRHLLQEESAPTQQPKVKYEDLLREYTDPTEPPALSYRDILKEPTEDAAPPPVTYRQVLSEEAKDHSAEAPTKPSPTPLERWNEAAHPLPMEEYLRGAEEKLIILSLEPQNALTFVQNMRDKLTGRLHSHNGYDLTDSQRDDATQALLEHLRDSNPQLVVDIAEGQFPDLHGWRTFHQDTSRDTNSYPRSTQDNQALYDALQKTLDGFSYPQDDSKREHLRHAVTELLTRPADDLMSEFKTRHRTWPPDSEPLSTEASRLENAPTDIGWGQNRQSHLETWEQIRRDLLLKEMEVRDFAAQHRTKYLDNQTETGAGFTDPTNPIEIENKEAGQNILRYVTPYTPGNDHHEPLLKKIGRNPAATLRVLRDHMDPETRYNDDQYYRRQAAYTTEQEIIPAFIERLRDNYPQAVTDLANEDLDAASSPDAQISMFRTITEIEDDLSEPQRRHLGWIVGHHVLREPQVWNTCQDIAEARERGDDQYDDRSQNDRLEDLANNVNSHDWGKNQDIQDWLLDLIRHQIAILETARKVPVPDRQLQTG